MKTVTFLRHYVGAVTGSQAYLPGQTVTLDDSVASVLLDKGVVSAVEVPPLEDAGAGVPPPPAPARKPATKRAAKKAVKP